MAKMIFIGFSSFFITKIIKININKLINNDMLVICFAFNGNPWFKEKLIILSEIFPENRNIFLIMFHINARIVWMSIWLGFTHFVFWNLPRNALYLYLSFCILIQILWLPDYLMILFQFLLVYQITFLSHKVGDNHHQPTKQKWIILFNPPYEREIMNNLSFL